MHPDKKARFQRLAQKIAVIIRQDIQQNGPMKPNYTSPKFWAFVQTEMKKFEDAKKVSDSDD
ncbi:MAG: hypothetical protein AAF787_11970 [Chloroflexota bacterium]